MRAGASLQMQTEKQGWRYVSTHCVLLFLMCFGTGTSLECPHKCICTGTTVECTNQNLTFIPQPLPANITTLILTGNDISSLTKESFPVRLDLLEELYLSGNRIEQVAPGVFYNLPGLRLLDLSNNKIINFSPEAFSQNNNLQVLNMNRSLYNFTYVDVVSNLLKHSVPKLSYLGLANNGLVVLPDDMFTNLSDLTTLDLSHNSIVLINNGTFRYQALHSLDLRENSLKNLSNETLLELNQISGLRLQLGGNGWVCDCNIEDMVTWLKTSDVVDKLNMTCADPLKLRNTKLLLLDLSKLQCTLSGNMKGVLETSYVFLGIVLALIGVIFLLVLYLNRKGIKRWMYNIRDACRDHMEGYHYRYEINSDPRLANLSLNSDV
ncbi:trophoblast glycoprotein b [Trichomycterus rosablanca]|uniref:trophoblast glycoprotein b n=1 Tax=Trichomycterus rosablanca TaxID=2290929 RepID=UPI002F35D691